MVDSDRIEGLAVDGPRDLQFVVQLCREVPAGSTLVLRATEPLSPDDAAAVIDQLRLAVPDTVVVLLAPELSLDLVCPSEVGSVDRGATDRTGTGSEPVDTPDASTQGPMTLARHEGMARRAHWLGGP